MMTERAALLVYWYAIHNVTRAINRGYGERMLRWQRRVHRLLGGGYRPMTDEDRIAEIRKVLAQLERITKEGPEF